MATALPFITPTADDDGKFEVNHDALKFLNTLNGKVAIIAVCGRYRTGKSFLMNRLVDKQTGFTVGSTVEACTKGIWLWSQSVKHELSNGEEVQILFLDTEGFGAQSATSQSDARIFSLATLLCSVLVYNSVGTIDEEAIANLSFVSALTKHIETRATGHGHGKESNSSRPVDTPSAEELARFFPGFLWVVRDFSLELRDDDGDVISERDYLEQSLAEAESFSSETQQRNRVRRMLKGFFRQRDCATLVRPLEDEHLLQELDKQTLRPEFRNQMKALRSKLFDQMLKPKSMNGRWISGRMLGQLATSYVAAMNDNAVPNIGNAWEEVAEAECKAAYEAALQSYQSRMNPLRETLPVDDVDLSSAHIEARTAAMVIFKRQAVGSAIPASARGAEDDNTEHRADMIAGTYRNKLKHMMQTQFDEMRNANDLASRKNCRLLLLQLARHSIQPRLVPGGEGYDSHEQLDADLQALRKDYNGQATGPHAQMELSQFLWRTAVAVLKGSQQRSEARLNDAVGTMQKQLDEAGQETANLRGERDKLSETLSSLREEHAEENKELHQLRAQVAVLTGQVEASEKQRKLAVEDTEALHRKVQDHEDELLRLKDKLATVQEEARTAKQDLSDASARADDQSDLVAELKAEIANYQEVAVNHEKEKLAKDDEVKALQKQLGDTKQKLAQAKAAKLEPAHDFAAAVAARPSKAQAVGSVDRSDNSESHHKVQSGNAAVSDPPSPVEGSGNPFAEAATHDSADGRGGGGGGGGGGAGNPFAPPPATSKPAASASGGKGVESPPANKVAAAGSGAATNPFPPPSPDDKPAGGTASSGAGNPFAPPSAASKPGGAAVGRGNPFTQPAAAADTPADHEHPFSPTAEPERRVPPPPSKQPQAQEQASPTPNRFADLLEPDDSDLSDSEHQQAKHTETPAKPEPIEPAAESSKCCIVQ